ncbi:MAG: class I SAM-dependent methyltransferase [Tetrasphaera sp.]
MPDLSTAAQQGHVYDTCRPEILPFVPDGIGSLLDVGCGTGGFGRLVRERFGPGLHLEGIEPVAAARESAEAAGFDVVRGGYFPEALERGDRFDCVVFNDVLEHMLDPWAALARTRAHLSRGGWVVASLPNILYLPVIARVIARRRWDYTDEGTLDRTHLRFFTRSTMLEMFAGAGFEVARAEGINNQWYTGRWDRLQPIAPLTGQFQYLQFVIVARPAAAR